MFSPSLFASLSLFVFFSVYGFNTFVRMSSMNWRAPAVFLLHVLMWQCLKIKGIYISIYLKIHQQPLPPTIKYHSMYSRIFFFWQASTPLLNFPWPPVKKLNIDLRPSQGKKRRGMLAAQVAMNTTIAAATGGLVVFVLRMIMLKILGGVLVDLWLLTQNDFFKMFQTYIYVHIHIYTYE